MCVINDKEVVLNQYKNTTNLNTRISIHDKYSVNKQGFGNWIVSYYQITEKMRILELGCGTGDMWKNNLRLINKCLELVLTDISEGMIEAARKNIGNLHNVTYQVVDIQNIPFKSNSFDIIIANMMLYHVPNLKKGLSEVKRVLKGGGSFYCATYGEHGILQYVAELLKPYGVEDSTNKNFTLQNGKQILMQYFTSIEMQEYIDSLEVTNIEDMLDYLNSLASMTSISNISRDVIKKILEQNMVDGILKVPKEYGMFICK
ncbi:MAG: class I SAM-dependent methyltransferase [Roseburia sp.]|nr:class I SAM-dependent methyltransferase [Anaeroplasma bactoclasticum]MCM1196897.1 class I SAM-dependent methyltransferase [Roseburia sp.]MCM1556714.1 class I SAM-dependent methyltransferase [Anaeroplasma bactoclasticum]